MRRAGHHSHVPTVDMRFPSVEPRDRLPLLRDCGQQVKQRLVTFEALILAALITLYPVAAQSADNTQGNTCTGTAAAAISGSTTGTSVVSPAGGNNLVCVSGTWQYPAYQFGSTSASCASGVAGAIQWTGSAFQGCNGTTWSNLSFIGSGITLGTAVSVTNPQRSGDVTTGFFSPAAATIALSIGGTEAMRVNSSGNVGIGTTNPNTALSIAPTVDGTSGGATADKISYFDDGANYISGLTKTFGSMGGIFIRGSNTTFNVFTNPTYGHNSTNDTAALTVRTNGNVGIGTTTPGYPLDMQASLNSVVASVLNTNGGSGAGGLRITTSEGNGNADALTVITGAYLSSPPTMLRVQDFGPYGGNLLLVESGYGFVGVGTTSPQALLDVNGYMRLAKNSSQPVACSSTNDGAIALTHAYTLCLCNGGTSSWVESNNGTTGCSW